MTAAASPTTAPPSGSAVPIEGNTQRLDGGAMFGNCPRALWERWFVPDAAHRITLAGRALLVTLGQTRVLFETGIGAFFPSHLRDRYGVVEPEPRLLHNLAAHGVREDDIDAVVLSHLHFDHAGGLLSPFVAGAARRLHFPRATYVVSGRALARAADPHRRDRASFIPELPGMLRASGRLALVAAGDVGIPGLPATAGLSFAESDGHTPGMLLTRVALPDGPVWVVGDLAPGVAWLHVPITMGYDRNPELLVDEKARVLGAVAAEGGRVFFTHDPDVALAAVVQTDKGSFAAAAGPPAGDIKAPGQRRVDNVRSRG